MNILIIGDVVGNPGRTILKKALPLVFAKHDIDYCIANIENAAGGFGVTKEVCDEILDAGVDCLTSGNHIWDKKEIIPVIDLIPQLLRPLELPRAAARPGLARGQGQALQGAGGHPQPLGPRLHERRPGRSLQAGAGRGGAAAQGSEGRSSWTSTARPARRRRPSATSSTAGSPAVVGTHTHVPTCDHRILPKGTAYVHATSA